VYQDGLDTILMSNTIQQCVLIKWIPLVPNTDESDIKNFTRITQQIYTVSLVVSSSLCKTKFHSKLTKWNNASTISRNHFRTSLTFYTDYLTQNQTMHLTQSIKLKVESWNSITSLRKTLLNCSAIKNRLHPLPCWQFQILLTLFSEFFSPFVHTTCFLSVLSQYLALDEIYHPY